MAAQPTGTVTLVFTDIEGSTRLLEELGTSAYRDALGEHRRVVRESFARFEGYEVDYEGDAFFYAFASAQAAVDAVTEAMHELEAGLIRIRVGIHTGSPEVDPPKYVGRDVHLAARVMSAGHGDQVLLSASTRELVEVRAVELGEHRLKDFAEPVSIFQLGTESFPPLKTISNTNLPRPASSFVGREREVADVVKLIRERARLVTLTGPGGSGKTRLAIEAATELVAEFKAGVFWVGLTTLRDPELVLLTIAQTLGAKDDLATHIADRELLLLLDNLEQVIAVAPQLATLIEACPGLRMLVTSRELLRVRGELEYEVLPLAGTEAVELFQERAQVTTSPAIEELCHRLDHMPLAVELAAARTKALSAEQILERLSDWLDLLRGGRDADPRQATLRATIEWSHDLLSSAEAELFARLSVFAGGSTLEAAEAVCDADVDLLQSLVEKSLLRHTGDRYSMLETIRQYATEQLSDSGEADEVADRHARWFLAFAKLHRTVPTGQLLDEVETELDNLRATRALFAKTGDVESELELAAALTSFFDTRGYWSEARTAVESALARADLASTPARAGGWQALAHLAFSAGDFARAEEAAQKSLDLHSTLGDDRGAVEALNVLGSSASERGDYDEAVRLAEEMRLLCLQIGDQAYLAGATATLGLYALLRGDTREGRALTAEALDVFRALGHERGIAFAVENLGIAELLDGRPEHAAPHLRESLKHGQTIGSPADVVNALVGLAGAAAAQGQPEHGARLLGAADALREESGVTQLEALEKRVWEQARSLIDASLDEDALDRSWREGSRLNIDDAIEEALSIDAHS